MKDKKERILMSVVYDSVAEDFVARQGYNPTHCDVRCAVNDRLDYYQKEGYTVYHGYSQDKAFKEVRKRLGTLRCR